MAQAKDNKSRTSRKQRWRALRDLWKQDAAKWVAFLEARGVPTPTVAGERIKLQCPYHDDRNPSAEIHLTKGHFRCYSGGCNHYEWDPLRFLTTAAILKLPSYGDAIKEFKSHFGASIPRAVSKEYEEDYAHRRRMRWIAECVQLKLDEAWQNPTNPESAQASVDWLKGRGVKDSAYHGSIGLWPRLSDITTYLRNKGGSNEDLQAIKTLFGQYFDIKYQDWVAFIYATDPANPTAFKIRKPLTPAQEKALGDKQVIFIAEKEGVKGFFGMLNPGYAPLIGDPNYKEAYITEGEMDALMVYENQVVSGQCDAIFLGAGGAGHNGMDGLVAAGITQANIIGDDDEGGEGFIDSSAERTEECSLRFFIWPKNLKHPGGEKMDPDSAIAQFGFVPTMNEFLTASNYIYPHTWAYDVASTELGHLAEDDVRSQTEVAKKYAKKLHHGAERQAFLDLVNKSYSGVSPTEVRRSISDDEDNHLNTVRYIVQKMLDHYHPHYWDPSTRRLSLWDKTDEFCFEFDPTRSDAIGLIATQMCGGKIYDWVRDEVGLPGYMVPIEGKDGMPSKGKETVRQTEFFIEQALLQLPSHAPKRPTDMKGQGVHLEHVRNTGQGYLVSGNHMYDLHWNQDGTKLEKVEPLKGPSCRNDVFLISQGQIDRIGDWANPIFTCEADFFRAPKYTAQEALDLVFKIFNEYWRFRHQTEDARMVALYPFYSYILDAFQRRVQIHLLGEHESGKSSCLSMMAGGLQLWDYRLTQCAITEMDATVAALLQFYPGARLALGLDELNDANDGSRRSGQVKDLYASLRGLAVHGRASRLRGSASFQANAAEIGVATVTASGTRIFDPMDASRYKEINLVKDASLGSLKAKLGRDFPPEFWPDLRHSIAYHSLHNAAAIAALSKTMELEYADNKSLPVPSSRFREGLYPLIAIAQQFGWNGYDLLFDICKAREEEELEASTQTRGQDILDAVFNIPTFPLDGESDHREVTIGEMLTNPSWRDNITSVPGVYLDSPTQTLAVSWSHMEGHLRRLGPSFTASNMQTLGQGCRLYVDPVLAKKNGSMSRFRDAGLTSSRYGIFNVNEYLKLGVHKLELSDKKKDDDEFTISEDDDTGVTF